MYLNRCVAEQFQFARYVEVHVNGFPWAFFEYH